jgi:hypothetical protein
MCRPLNPNQAIVKVVCVSQGNDCAYFQRRFPNLFQQRAHAYEPFLMTGIMDPGAFTCQFLSVDLLDIL